MKQKEKKSTEMVKVSKSSLISVVASQIKGRNLFPEKVEEAKKILSKARLVK